MPRNELQITAPLIGQPVRWMAVVSVSTYHRIAYRIRGWGSLPMRRGSTLLVANHQHDIESPVVVADLTIRSFTWRWPIFTVSSRRMWEPGFFAERVPWLRILRNVNLGGLFSIVGLQPIENELHTRPFVSVAYTMTQRHGNLAVAEVFRDRVAAQLPPGVTTLRDILAPANFTLARSPVKLTDIADPYRAEMLQLTREELEADIAHFERLQRDGATIFLAPEGFYTPDGKMQRFRGILPRLRPIANSVWLTAISYDPYVDRRLSMLYRVTQAGDAHSLETQLKATRPVTASALICAWIASGARTFTRDEAVVALRHAVAALPHAAFVVPELRSDVERSTERVIHGMLRWGALVRAGSGYAAVANSTHPQFPRAIDIIEYQSNFHAETLEGLAAISGDPQVQRTA